jgi:hypothetical protein
MMILAGAKGSDDRGDSFVYVGTTRQQILNGPELALFFNQMEYRHFQFTAVVEDVPVDHLHIVHHYRTLVAPTHGAMVVIRAA